MKQMRRPNVTHDELKMEQMIEDSVMSPLQSVLKKAKVDNAPKTVRKLRRFECIWDEDKPSTIYVPDEIHKLIPPGFVVVMPKGEL